MKDLKEMTYKEFKEYCNDRACDGQWSAGDVMMCLEIRNRIESVQVKKFGIVMKKKTEKAQEEAWQELLAKII